jgi:hypothetical protein
MNLKAYAAHRKAQGLRGTSHVAVLRAINSGRLHSPAVHQVDGRWVIDAAMADGQWANNTTQNGPPETRGEVAPAPAAAVAPAPRSAPSPAVTAAAAAVASFPPQQGLTGKAQAEAIRTTYQAKLLELDYKQRLGELLAKDEADRVRFEETRRARDAFRRLPLLIVGDVAMLLGGITPEQRASLLILLERNIVTILEELGEEDSD